MIRKDFQNLGIGRADNNGLTVNNNERLKVPCLLACWGVSFELWWYVQYVYSLFPGQNEKEKGTQTKINKEKSNLSARTNLTINNSPTKHPKSQTGSQVVLSFSSLDGTELRSLWCLGLEPSIMDSHSLWFWLHVCLARSHWAPKRNQQCLLSNWCIFLQRLGREGHSYYHQLWF